MPLAGLSDPFHKIQYRDDYRLEVNLNDFLNFKCLPK